MRQAGTVRAGAGRAAAAASLLCAAVFVAAVVDVVRRTPAFRSSDFVSALGADAAPGAAGYRLAILAAALSAGLLGIALRAAYPEVAAPVFLAAAATLLATSALLPCDAGCPMPVIESTGGVVNALHVFTTMAAFVFLAAAIATVAGRSPDRLLRRMSAIAVVLLGSLMAAFAVLLLVATHTPASAAAERILLTVAFGWLVLCAARLLTARPARR